MKRILLLMVLFVPIFGYCQKSISGDNNEQTDKTINKALKLVFDASSNLCTLYSDLSDNYQLKQTFYYKRTDESLTANPCFNFSADYIVNKSTLVTTLIKSCGDDISATGVQNGWIGANHGLSLHGRLSVTGGHGKTYADIGSKWKDDSGYFWYITAIYSETELGILSENLGTANIYNFRSYSLLEGTLIHVNGAKNTTSFTPSSKAMQQWYPSEVPVLQKIELDGVGITESGTYYGNLLNCYEVYDVYNPASYFAAILARKNDKGAYTGNPLPKSLVADGYKIVKMLRYSNIYRFTEKGLCMTFTDWTPLNLITLSKFFPLDVKLMNAGNLGGIVSFYLPKALAITAQDGRAYDFRVPCQFVVPKTDDLHWTSSYWEDSNLPPDRAIEFVGRNAVTRMIALGHGYIFDQGIGGTSRKNYLNDAWWIYTSSASYNGALDGKIAASLNYGSKYSFACFRKYDDISANPEGIIAIQQFEVNGKYYIYADFNAAGEYEIEIPDKWVGKKLTVFEKRSNVTLSIVTPSKVNIVVANANPMYGYIVMKIE